MPLVASALAFPGSVRAEQGQRVLLWPVGQEIAVGDDALEAARTRISQFGEVVDLPVPAPAGPSVDEQRLRAESSARVAEAQALYYEASFARAAESLETHFRAQGEALAENGCTDSLRNIMLWLGASLAKLDRGDDAVTWFIFAIRLGLEEIDRALFPPDVTSVFDRARELVSAATAGNLALTLRPEDAVLEIDGRIVSVSPEGSMELAVGRHLLVARRTGYRTLARAVEVAEEGVTEVVLELPAADTELLAQQVAVIRRDEGLRPDDHDHLRLAVSATESELVAIVEDAGEPRLVNSMGEQIPWPEPVVEPEAIPEDEVPTQPPADPVWRRWWFWVALVGGAAVLATGVGVGVYYGTRPDELTITIVPGEGP